MDEVESLDEDRILRQFYHVILATLRTNAYQKTAAGELKTYISIKLDPESIPNMPLPKPQYEIFVYSPRVEGVHLRSSKVARGGLRWSDRREDFRTEILGLVKAQKVKNAVIVPSGAKGGFVTKRLPEGSREQIMEEVVDCYKTFIRGLLDITDNVVEGTVIPPINTVRYDDDDPYLVVAADKGTATFSNYANEVSLEYGHWLGDAFASGGEAGYDHKKMGITAKGAWESVKRHFRELSINTQTEDFTVVGIGDMAGDVFGNGMLLSEHIQLIAAFNHLHIFIDPNPDPAKSYAERKRLFELPRSAWTDYKQELISEGGGIFNRSAKSITLTPQIMKRFNIRTQVIEPNQLIKEILKSKYDLLWNGGIGTFVKASYEHHSDAGDRNNDPIRVNGNELQCRVIGEGGNLGCTQLGRVESSRNGGIVYTDFIDNSAGVDCSDHEVNIKILLNKVVANGDMTEKQRNKLLAEMTDDVASLVLRNNYLQTQAVSIAASQSHHYMDSYTRFIHELEAEKKLDRALEFLPDDKALFERKSDGQGLTRPEVSILLAYSKTLLKESILRSSITEEPYIARLVETAFPERLCKKFKKQVYSHSLKNEIIATQLSNAVVNDMGIVFCHRVNEETGHSYPEIVKAYYVSREVFGMAELWKKIESLDHTVDSEVQIEMMIMVGRLVRRATRWFLKNHRNLDDLESTINLYKPGVEFLYQNLGKLLIGEGREHLEEHRQAYLKAGVPEETADRVASCLAMFCVLDIVAASNQHNLRPSDVAKTYFSFGAKLELAWFRWIILVHPVESHWESLAKSVFRDDIDYLQRELTVGILKFSPGSTSVDEAIEKWSAAQQALVERWRRVLSELRSSSNRNFVMFAVSIRGLSDLAAAESLSNRQHESTGKEVNAVSREKEET